MIRSAAHILLSVLEQKESRSMKNHFEALRIQTNPFYIRRCQPLGQLMCEWIQNQMVIRDPCYIKEPIFSTFWQNQVLHRYFLVVMSGRRNSYVELDSAKKSKYWYLNVISILDKSHYLMVIPFIPW